MYYSSRNNATSLGSTQVLSTRVVNGVATAPRADFKLHHSRHGTGSISPERTPISTVHSSPIRLPKTHIHRTPSELQLAQEKVKADYHEWQMYARLVHGMSHHCEDSESEMHPLTAKSLRGVVNTHNKGLHSRSSHVDDDVQDDNDWEVSYQEEIKKTRSSVVSDDDEEEDDGCLFDLEM